VERIFLNPAVNSVEAMSSSTNGGFVLDVTTGMNTSTESQPMVIVIDDDHDVRDAVANLLRSIGLQTKLFASVADFLHWKRPDVPSCLVLDVRLRGLSGLDFQSELNKASIELPIVFMTAHGDIPMTVRAMKGGAVDFLAKPFRDQDMIDAVQVGLDRDKARRLSTSDTSQMKSAYDSLTPREQEIMALVSDGLMNKQIAGKIGVGEVTVKFHRGNVMRKMGAKSVAELVRMADTLGVRRPAR
jgi:FixJ family two-component response regulator